MARPRLKVVPITFADANEFVSQFHRHRGRVAGCKFCVAVSITGEEIVRGVAIVGRPVSRVLDNGWTLEVNRCCTDGTANACSALYGAAWRAARSLGYRRVITYTKRSEPGTSLLGAGWTLVGKLKSGGTWDCPSRPRIPTPREDKMIWERA